MYQRLKWQSLKASSASANSPSAFTQWATSALWSRPAWAPVNDTSLSFRQIIKHQNGWAHYDSELQMICFRNCDVHAPFHRQLSPPTGYCSNACNNGVFAYQMQRVFECVLYMRLVSNDNPPRCKRIHFESHSTTAHLHKWCDCHIQ